MALAKGHFKDIPINQCSVEILLIIFDGLSLDDIFLAQKVCRRWRNIIRTSSYLWKKQMMTMKQNEGHAVQRKFDQLIPASSNDALMLREAVKEVHQNLKNLRTNLQQGTRRVAALELGVVEPNVERDGFEMTIDFKNGLLAVYSKKPLPVTDRGQFQMYHLHNLAAAGGPLDYPSSLIPDYDSWEDFKCWGELIVIFGRSASESELDEPIGIAGEIWNWRKRVKLCVLKRNSEGDYHKICGPSCIFKDNFIMAPASDRLIVWKYDDAAEDGMEKALTPMWKVACGRDCDPSCFFKVTYGNNKLFFTQGLGGGVKFLCLLTATINNVLISDELYSGIYTGGHFRLNYPQLMILCNDYNCSSPLRFNQLRFGLLTETPVKCYLSRIRLEDDCKAAPKSCFCKRCSCKCLNVASFRQESRRCIGMVERDRESDMLSDTLVLVAQRSDEVETGQLYAVVDMDLQSLQCEGSDSDSDDSDWNQFNILGMDDYFVVLYFLDGDKSKVAVFDYFDV